MLVSSRGSESSTGLSGVMARAHKFMQGAEENLPNYLAGDVGTAVIELQSPLPAVVLRGYFTDRLVDDLIVRAKEAGLPNERGIMRSGPIPQEPGSVVAMYAAAVSRGVKGRPVVFANEYTPSRNHFGGPVHNDTGARDPVVILGKGNGFTRVAIEDGVSNPKTRRRVDRGVDVGDIYFGAGDVLVMDGRTRPHQGRAADRGSVRTTIVGYTTIIPTIND